MLPPRHVDFHNAGWEATTRAMEATVHSDKALPIFDKAIDRFKEVTCTGLLNWGNVHTCIAHKYLDEAAAAGGGRGWCVNAWPGAGPQAGVKRGVPVLQCLLMPSFAQASRYSETTHQLRTHTLPPSPSPPGAELSTVLAKVTAELDKAEAQFVQAAAFKPDFTDLLLARGQIEAERAKLAAGLLVKNPP